MQQLVWAELNLPSVLSLTRGIIQVNLKEYQRFQIQDMEMDAEMKMESMSIRNMPLVPSTPQMLLVKYQQVVQGLLR